MIRRSIVKLQQLPQVRAATNFKGIGGALANSKQAPTLLIHRRSLAGPSLVQHQNTPDNNEQTHFDFTMENYKRVEQILAKYPSNYKQSACIPLLDLAQRQIGNFLTLAAMNKVAQIIGVNPMRVYETATFYTMFYRQKVGKYIVQVCTTTPCQACGAYDILKACEEELHLHPGETSKDGKFTLIEVECLGACVNAPMIQVNDDFIECLTPESTKQVLQMYKQDKVPPMTKWGSLPMNGQLSCEGPLGKTSLKSPPWGPGAFMRPDGELQGKVTPADVKKAMFYDSN